MQRMVDSCLVSPSVSEIEFHAQEDVSTSAFMSENIEDSPVKPTVPVTESVICTGITTPKSGTKTAFNFEPHSEAYVA